jgi:diguanylate cyclase (GGDEF)-like protein/PAS domain S-box-containing protein
MPPSSFQPRPLSPPSPLTSDPASSDTGVNPLLELLQRVTGAGAWAMELPSRALTVTPGFAARLGPGDALPESLHAFYASESQAQMAAVLQECELAGQPFDEEAQMLGRDGQRFWVRSTGEAVRDAAGNVIRLHGVVQDISEQKRHQHEATAITLRLGTTLASISEAFVTLDRQGRVTFINGEAERLLQRPARDLLGREIWQELDTSGNGRLRAELNAVLGNGLHNEFEEFHPELGKWLEVRIHPFEEGLALYLRDVSERRRSQEQLLLLETSISRLNDIVVITEAGSINAPGPRIVFVNDAFERHTGYHRHEALGQTPRMLQGRLTQRKELARIRTALTESQPVRAELINYKKNGELFWLELDIVPVDYFSRGLTHWVAVGRDITERKATEDEIEHLAFYDVLTQLPNRQLLMDRLERALARSTDESRIGALMFIDLDHFKVLNDTLGHSRGDLLLQKVAARLNACLRPTDTVARLGGDEFVVMLEDLKEDTVVATAKIRVVGEKILAALSEPYDLAGHLHHSTCSIGITLFSKEHNEIGDLLKQADLAMYQAKAAGRNAVCFFDPDMQAVATANAALGTQLRQGLRQQEFLLHYQPQVGRDGRMMGVEALMRWQHPQRGLVYPGEFIGQAEESGLILPMGQWALETACVQLAQWASQPAMSKLSIAVNVSARQFRHPEFVELVMNLIHQHGIQPGLLKLELTESLLATGMEVTIAKMGRLKNAGVTLSIDDFGMGYSALSYLKYLPLDQLKIDRAFVKDVLTDPNDAAIARTIIGLAQSLGLGVMAEGVETEAQRAFLAWNGCECYQGHLFCEALPIDALEQFVSRLPA